MAFSSPYTAGSVMDAAAALLNDASKTLFTYTVQLPFLKMANQELEQNLQVDGVPIGLKNTAAISVAAAAITLTLPSDFFMPITLQERKSGATIYSPMSEVADVKVGSPEQTTNLNIWDFSNNVINFVGATEAKQVLMRYWRLFDVQEVGGATAEVIVGGNNVLAYRTAGLVARFVGGNNPRADMLDANAAQAYSVLGFLYVKNTQGIRRRRRPFRRNGSWGEYRVIVA